MIRIEDEKLIIEIGHPCPEEFAKDLKEAIIGTMQHQDIGVIGVFLKFRVSQLTSDCEEIKFQKSDDWQENCLKWGMTHSTNLLFSDRGLLHQRFLTTDLGELYQAIPFAELAAQIPAPKHAQSGKGRKPWFDVKGGLGLMFLKHYLGISDALLIERINTDWSMQLFCGICLAPTEKISDTNLPSYWRGYLGKHMAIDSLQQVLAQHWKPFMKETRIGMQDATCYESRIAYPTDIKLLWASCLKVHSMLQRELKIKGMRKSRVKFGKQKKVFLEYQLCKKKTKRKEKKLRKKLLLFLLRLMNLLKDISPALSSTNAARMQTIIKLYQQQQQKAYGDPTEAIKDRIVSLSKPYIRPIVRGKEVKPVEFGAKVNKLVVDGIGFIEHLSYDAFNECKRFKNGIYLQRKLFGKCSHQSGDKIYATNENRVYCKAQNIQTNFIPKGKQKTIFIEQSAVLRKELNKERGTVLEGSFGNDKNHYLLQKVNARNIHTEKCWIFFGIHTANASSIATRIIEKAQKNSRAA